MSACTVHRYARLQELSDERAQKLEDSMKLQQFLRDVDEVFVCTTTVCPFFSQE